MSFDKHQVTGVQTSFVISEKPWLELSAYPCLPDSSDNKNKDQYQEQQQPQDQQLGGQQQRGEQQEQQSGARVGVPPRVRPAEGNQEPGSVGGVL